MTQQTTAPATVAATGPRAGSAADPAASVSKLGYVEFTTPDIDRLLEYYTSVLCFELVDRSPDQAYLTTGFDHHCVVLTRGAAHGRTTVGYEIAGSLDDAEVHAHGVARLEPRHFAQLTALDVLDDRAHVERWPA